MSSGFLLITMQRVSISFISQAKQVSSHSNVCTFQVSSHSIVLYISSRGSFKPFVYFYWLSYSQSHEYIIIVRFETQQHFCTNFRYHSSETWVYLEANLKIKVNQSNNTGQQFNTFCKWLPKKSKLQSSKYATVKSNIP